MSPASAPGKDQIPKHVHGRVQELAGALGITGPVELRVSRRGGSNAWVPASGKRRITFTRRKLADPDLDWTLAHELAHLAAPPAVSRRLQTRYRLFAGLHLLFVVALWLQLKLEQLLLGSAALGLFLLELAALLWLFAARREEEYRADRVATRLVGPRRTADFYKHPRYVDGRLRRLGAYVEYWLQAQVDDRTPLGRLLYLFQSHPTLQERARALSNLELS